MSSQGLEGRAMTRQPIEDDILSILNDDIRPALTVREIKIETAVRGLGHQGTGYSVERIRRALTVLRKERAVRGFGRRIGKQARMLMWTSARTRPWVLSQWSDEKVCWDLGIRTYSPKTKAQAAATAGAQETKAPDSAGTQETKADSLLRLWVAG